MSEAVSDQEDVEMLELSDLSRAEIQHGYRNLMDDIARNEENLIKKTVDSDDNELLGYLKKGEELWGGVKGAQECLLDSRVTRNLSRITRQQVLQMSVNINQFQYEEYADKLRSSLNLKDGRLDLKKWVMLGQQAKTMFRRSPALSTMFGALNADHPEQATKERKVRQATKFSELKETQADIVEETEMEINITDRIVQKVFKVLVEKFKENEKKPINFYVFVLDPLSFGASVENMFHVSFLIKENKAGITICPDTKMPLIKPISSKQKDLSKESRGENGRNQVVMNFTHQDWVTLVRKLEIKSAMITV